VASFADITIGAEIPPLVRGPMSPLHLMRFSAAIENWHRIHYDERFAIDHDGLPGLLVSGSWKQHFVAQAVRDWAGPNGWLASLDLQFRRMNVAGETLTAWGRVTAIDDSGAVGRVGLVVGVRNQDGVESSPGNAVALLPLPGGRTVANGVEPPR
jgi:acyl dehydratase